MIDSLKKKIVKQVHELVREHVNKEFVELVHYCLMCVFIITDKAKASRGGGKRCRCYERRRAKA